MTAFHDLSYSIEHLGGLIFGQDYRLDTKVQSKLRMSFSESKLDRNIAILKARNDNLRTLCAQTRSSSSNHPQVISQKAPVDLRSYAIIRKAARALHEALSSACTKHTEHLAHFRVEIEEVMIKNDTCPKVKFSLGFTHLTLAKADRSHDSLWFIVDTAINEHTATPVDEVKSKDHELDEILQRQLNIGACSPSQQVKKAVRFGSSIDAPTPHPGLMAKNAFIQEGGMPRDLCDNLHRLLSEPCDIKICVGVFGNIGQFKHFVYPSSCTRKSKSRSAVTLSQLIRRPSTVDPIQYLATDDRIGLARRLATAVLQYHTTPWLKPSWRSDDVVFFDDSGSDQLQPNLFAPYLNTKFSESSDHPSSGTSFTDMVRNPLLFSLGVVLLEIAHGVSLNALRQPIDLQNGGDRFQDLLTAQRLAKSRGSIMGSKYHAIVEHCIFPPGDDLNDVRLQGAFHQSVVKPLREIEAGFKELYLDD